MCIHIERDMCIHIERDYIYIEREREIHICMHTSQSQSQSRRAFPHRPTSIRLAGPAEGSSVSDMVAKVHIPLWAAFAHTSFTSSPSVANPIQSAFFFLLFLPSNTEVSLGEV